MTRNDDDRNEEREERIRQLMERAQKHLRARKGPASAKTKASVKTKPRKPKKAQRKG